MILVTIVNNFNAVIEMTECLTQQRHLKLRALVPEKLKSATDSDLRLSLISLKNTQSAIAIHVMKIESELSKRGVSKYIIHQERDTESPKKNLDEDAADEITLFT